MRERKVDDQTNQYATDTLVFLARNARECCDALGEQFDMVVWWNGPTSRIDFCWAKQAGTC